MNIKDYLVATKKEIDIALDQYLPSKDEYPSRIMEAMRYSIFSGGKRLRPILLIAALETVGGEKKSVFSFAGAIEMIHTYTLIHDDLPALDNDDFRRGNVTSHKVFGEAVAILAGDALLTHAFQIMADITLVNDISESDICKIIFEVAKAIGVYGTIGGQVVDMDSEGKKINLSTLEYIHTHKTGKLINTAIMAGAILGKGSKKEINSLSNFGYNIGLAFQIIDDILDIEGDKNKLGKDTGSDIKKKKSTYPSIVGIKESKAKANALVEEGLSFLTTFGKRGDVLKKIARFIVERTN